MEQLIMKFLGPNVDKMLKSRDVAGLVKALEHKDSNVVEAAVEALGQLRDPRALDAIVARLVDRTPFQSEKQISLTDQMQRYSRAMAAILGEGSTGGLVHVALATLPLDVQHCWIHTLGEVGAIDTLLTVLEKPPSPDSLFCCVAALGRLKSSAAIEPLCRLMARTASQKAENSPRTSTLQAISKTFDEALVGFIAATLTQINSANVSVEAALLSALDQYPDYEGSGNVEVVVDLDSIRSKQPRRPSITTDGGEHSKTLDPFEEIVKALGALGRTAARERLLEEAGKCIKPEHQPKSSGTTMTVSEWYAIDQECEKIVKQALSQIDACLARQPHPPEGWGSEPAARPEKLSPLAPRSEPQIVNADQEMIELPNPQRIGDGKPFALLLKPNVEEVFRNVGSSEFIKHLHGYLRHPEPQVRIDTLLVADQYGVVAKQQAILDALADSNVEVRTTAVNVLWGYVDAIEFAITRLYDLAHGHNSLGTTTTSTMTPAQAREGIAFLRGEAPNQGLLERFEALYKDVWGGEAEQRGDAGAEAQSATQDDQAGKEDLQPNAPAEAPVDDSPQSAPSTPVAQTVEEPNLKAGIDLYNSGRFADSIPVITRAIEANPQSAIAFFFRGSGYKATQQIDLALQDLNRAIELQPNYADAYNMRGLVQFAKGNPTLAQADLTQAITVDPGHFTAYFNRASLYRDQGNPVLARQDCLKAIELKPDYADAHNLCGVINFDQHNLDQALQCFNQALRYNPGLGITYQNRGDIYMQQGNYVAALQDFNQVIQRLPNHALGYYKRGEVYHRQGNFAQALQDFNQAIQLNLSFPEAYNMCGVVYFAQGNFTQALQYFHRAVELNPSFAVARQNRGDAFLQLGNYPAALQDYSSVIQVFPNHALGYYKRGEVYHRQGNYAQAVQEFNQAIQHNPAFPEAHNMSGVIFFIQGNYAQALQYFNRALELNPAFVIVYKNRGESHYHLGNKADALRDLKTYAQHMGNPVDPATQNLIAELERGS